MKTIILVLLFSVTTLAENSNYFIHQGSPNALSFVMLHGDTRTGESFSKYTGFKPKENTIVFFSADKKTWSIHKKEKYQENKSFVLNTISQLQKDGTLSSNIVLVGMSTGGLLAADIACNSKLDIEGLALFSSSLIKGFKCKRAIKTLFAHGTKDPFIKYNKEKSFKGVNLLSAKSAEMQWVQFNKCNEASTSKIDNNKKDKTSIFVKSYKGCAQPYKSLIVSGGGHTWLGVKNKFVAKKIIGLSTSEIKANQLLVDFFKN